MTRIVDDLTRVVAGAVVGAIGAARQVSAERREDAAQQPRIDELQRRLRPLPAWPRSRRDYRRVARWWELEAERGYSSTESSLRYARNMRWAAELAGLYGDGSWLELIARAGVANPEGGRR